MFAAIRSIVRPRYRVRQLKRHFSSARRLYYVHDEYHHEPEVRAVLDAVKQQWRLPEVDFFPVTQEELVFYPVRSSDVILAHKPILAKTARLIGSHCYGLWPLNRAERMQFLQNNGFPLSTWSRCQSVQELAALFDKWGVDTILLKRDSSMRALGVQMVTKSDLSGLNWGEGDIFSPILSEDPTTYKVHLLGDIVIGAFALQTLTIGERLFQESVKEKSQVVEFKLPASLKKELTRLGQKILVEGGGYIGVDLMKQNGNYVAIELNTNSIGTKSLWGANPSRASTALLKACEQLFVEQSQFVFSRACEQSALTYFLAKI